MLILFRGLGGIGVGIASIVVPLYIAEISPSQFRGRAVTSYQLAITFGILIAYISNYLIIQHLPSQTHGQWRTMFLVGAIPAILLSIGAYFVPESPRWLLKVGRNAEVAEISAKLNLQNLQDSPPATKGKLKDLFLRFTEKHSYWVYSYRYSHNLVVLMPLFTMVRRFFWIRAFR